LADIFGVPTRRFRSDGGRLDAALIARALGVTLKALAEAIGVGYTTLHKTPNAEGVQPKLAPFASVLAILDQVYDGDAALIQSWLGTPQRELGGKSPREALLVPGAAPGIEEWLTGAWMGQPD
jgi:hypothetical protein